MAVEGAQVLTRPISVAASRRAISYAPTLSAEAFSSLGCMDGVYEPVVTPAHVPVRETTSIRPGYLWAACLAAAAYAIHYLPIEPFSVASGAGVRRPISAAIIAILAGLLVRNLFTLPGAIRPGCRHIVKKAIPIAIVCTGAGLNLSNVAGLGYTALLITVTCLVVGVAASYGLARTIGLGSRTSLLLGAGTGICGNSAIVAVAPLIDANDKDVVLSIGTVNLFGLLAMLAWPIIGHQLTLTDEAFGIWCGTSIHAVPQVVAAGFAYSPDAGAVATLVKLVRVTLLAPLIFVLALIHSRHTAAATGETDALSIRYSRLIPWFVWGFILLAFLNTMGFLPSLQFPLQGLWSAAGQAPTLRIGSMLTTAGELLLTLAMVAIGLDVNIRELSSVGGRAILAGLLSTVVLGAASLASIAWLL